MRLDASHARTPSRAAPAPWRSLLLTSALGCALVACGAPRANAPPPAAPEDTPAAPPVDAAEPAEPPTSQPEAPPPDSEAPRPFPPKPQGPPPLPQGPPPRDRAEPSDGPEVSARRLIRKPDGTCALVRDCAGCAGETPVSCPD